MWSIQLEVNTRENAFREAGTLDYDTPIEGLRAIDRYTIEIRLTRPDPTFIYNLAFGGLSAVPREVVEAALTEERVAQHVHAARRRGRLQRERQRSDLLLLPLAVRMI